VCAFDTQATITFLYNEPGHGAITELPAEVFAGDADGFLTETNVSEVCSLVARFEGVDDTLTDALLRDADRDSRALERQGLSIKSADWRLAAEVKADGSISLADAYAVALADDRDTILVAGADNKFENLPLPTDLFPLREDGV
jgi:predicted nucleic acid-binding protein